MLIVYISNITILISNYFANFSFYNKIWNTFWGNSSNSGKIFTLQKKVFRIMADAQPEVHVEVC